MTVIEIIRKTTGKSFDGTHHIMRGGSWIYEQSFCRVSRRNYISSVIRASNCRLHLFYTIFPLSPRY